MESLSWVYIHPYYLVDDHPLLYGSNGSLHPSTYESKCLNRLPARVRVKLTAHSHDIPKHLDVT